MSNKTKCVCLIGILIIATFFRFYHLTTTPPGLYMDEAMDGVNAQNVAQTGQFKVYYPEDNGREGLYVNLLAIAFKYHLLPETAPWSVRFPAAVAGLLTVLGLYLLVSELFVEGSRVSGVGSESEEQDVETKNSGDYTPNPKPHTLTWLSKYRYQLALLSAFLLATSFWHINFSRIGFRAILAPFCLVWASYLLLKLFRSRSTIGYWLLAVGAGIFYGLGFYTYIAFRITPLLLILFIPFFRKYPGFWKRAILFLAITFLVAAPIGWYYLHNRADFFGRTSQISISSSRSPVVDLAKNIVSTALMFNWRGDGNWRHNLSNAPELFFPVGIIFIVGIVLAGIAVFRRKPKNQNPEIKNQKSTLDSGQRFALYFLFAWFILSALPEVFSNDGIPHALRSLLMVIPAMVFAAIGIIALYRLVAAKLNTRWMGTFTALFIAIVVAGAYVQYFAAWAKNTNVPGSFNADYVAIGNEINALPPATQKYVVIEAGGVVDYGLPMPVEPVLYVTNSFVPDATAQKVVNNIHYLLPNEIGQIPAGTPSNTIFTIR